MITKRIIPCLDVKEGMVVKGVQFKKSSSCWIDIEFSRKIF